VACVWAGNAAVHLTVTRAGGTARKVILNIPSLQPRSIRLDPGTLELIGLAPNTHSRRPIAPADYRARLVVRPN
jgi:hypothetical protein